MELPEAITVSGLTDINYPIFLSIINNNGFRHCNEVVDDCTHVIVLGNKRMRKTAGITFGEVCQMIGRLHLEGFKVTFISSN